MRTRTSILRTPTLHCTLFAYYYFTPLISGELTKLLLWWSTFCVFCPKGVQINSGFTLVLHPSHRARVPRARKVGGLCGHLLFGLWFSKLLLGFSSKLQAGQLCSSLQTAKLGCEPLEFSILQAMWSVSLVNVYVHTGKGEVRRLPHSLLTPWVLGKYSLVHEASSL